MNDVKVLANAIRLELLTELRTARSPTARRGAVPDDPDGAAAHEGADEGPATAEAGDRVGPALASRAGVGCVHARSIARVRAVGQVAQL